MIDWYKWEGDTLYLFIKVQPKSSRDEFCPPLNDHLKIKITAPPIDGKANSHLIKFLSKSFGTSKSSIEIISGATSKIKRIKISNPKKFPINIPPTSDS